MDARNDLSSKYGYKLILIHVLGICVFVGYDIVALYMVNMPPTGKGYLTFLLEIATFYANLAWIVPHLFSSAARVSILLRLLLLVVLHMVARTLINNWQDVKLPLAALLSFGRRGVLGLWRLGYVLGLGFLFGLIQQYEKRRREQQELKLSIATANAEMARIESVLYQMQLGPHLLFNALGVIQTRVQQVVPEVAESISLVANIVRYSLLDISKIKKVALAAEISQINNRIRVEEQLLGKQIWLNFNVDIDEGIGALELPPSLLLTLVDNVVKYGDLTKSHAPATVTLQVKQKQLYFHTWNLTLDRVQHGSGLGLRNVKHILEYYYPAKHQLKMEGGSPFSLHLNIEL